jgi:hypothetical protein
MRMRNVTSRDGERDATLTEDATDVDGIGSYREGGGAGTTGAARGAEFDKEGGGVGAAGAVGGDEFTKTGASDGGSWAGTFPGALLCFSDTFSDTSYI